MMPSRPIPARATPSRRSFVVAALLGTCALVGVAASLGDARADGPKPCLKASYEIAQVQAACTAGGQDAVKKLMKAAVDKGKAAGKEIKCASCHSSLKDFTLTPNAVADLKPLL